MVAIEKAPPTGGVRFAPSPTGRLHIGNLRTAWISAQIAHAKSLPWVVRFEDIDRPRVVAGAQGQQLEDLNSLGLIPDTVVTQTDFLARHRSLLLTAIENGTAYPCDCSRKAVQHSLVGMASAPHDGIAPIYTGQCRDLDPKRDLSSQDSVAWRFRAADPSGKDDFIIARTQNATDFVAFTPAYHWACAIDDHDGAYDMIVRGSDLASALVSQRMIQEWICKLEGKAVQFPEVFHAALITQNDGHRLEKRTAGITLVEVIASGNSVEEILQKFQKSFSFNDVRLGKEVESLTLAQLGL
jgi:glutamyl-tRNA synthetase